MHISLSLHQLLPVLYRGASNPGSWTTFLSLLCDGLNARMAAVVALDEKHNLTFLQQTGMDAASQKACASCFLQESAAQQPVTFRRREALMDQYHRAEVRLRSVPGFARAGITVLRSRKQATFNAEELAFLEQLAPHLEEALGLQQQFASLRLEEGLLDRLGRSFDLAYILLDDIGRPHLLSPSAQQIVARGDGLRMLNGRLHATRQSDTARLHRMLASACLSDPSGSRPLAEGTTMTVVRRGFSKPLQITLQSLPQQGDAPCAVLFLRDPNAQPASRATVLRQLYHLLPSEVRLAESLTYGLDVKHAAARMHITENSARTLLKSVFRKVEVNSQAGLIRTVLTLPAE